MLHPLTSLRFVAAAFVAFHHFAFLSAIHPNTGWIDGLLGLGYISVNFFFVLSGFVLAWNYIDGSGHFRVSRRSFWAARFARLYPAYALALLVALPRFLELAARGEAPAPGALPLDNPAVVFATLVTTPLLLQDWFGLLAWNTVAWSLSVEAFFYLTFPFLAPRIGHASRNRLAGWACVCSVVPVGVALVVFGGALSEGRSASWYEVTTLTEAFFYASPVVHWPEFILGVIAGRLFQLRSQEGRLSMWRPRYEYAAAGATLFLLLVFGLLPGPIFIAMMAPVFAWLIFSLAHSRSGLARLLSLPWLTLLGNASYSLYLFHATIIYTFLAIATLSGSSWLMSWPAFVLCFLVIVVFSIAVFRSIEEPARDWLRLRLYRVPGEAPATSRSAAG